MQTELDDQRLRTVSREMLSHLRYGNGGFASHMNADGYDLLIFLVLPINVQNSQNKYRPSR